MRWVEVVEVEADVVALAVAADAGRAGWVAPRPPVRVATVFAPTAGIESRTPSGSPAMRKSARSVARRWYASEYENNLYS